MTKPIRSLDVEETLKGVVNHIKVTDRQIGALVSLLSHQHAHEWLNRVEEYCEKAGIDSATGTPFQPET